MDVMTPNPVACTPDTQIRSAAEMMVAHDCGALPVVEGAQSRRLVGVVTDRDIVVRLVARGRNPLASRVADAMTGFAVTVDPRVDVSEARRLMQEHHLSRLIAVDADGACVGVVALADLAAAASRRSAGAVREEASRPRAETERMSG